MIMIMIDYDCHVWILIKITMVIIPITFGIITVYGNYFHFDRHHCYPLMFLFIIYRFFIYS